MLLKKSLMDSKVLKYVAVLYVLKSRDLRVRVLLIAMNLPMEEDRPRENDFRIRKNRGEIRDEAGAVVEDNNR